MAEGDGTTAEELVRRVLEDLRALSGEISSAAVLSEDGNLRASTLAPGVDRERYGAMLGALAGLARRIARENGAAGFAQTTVKEEEGYVLLVGLEGGGTLAATAGPEARIGLALYDARNARKEVERMLRDGEEEER